ncbi:dihydrolipoyl dehydrogenase [Alkalibacterium putridalgicola]|uniref:dihydrolipoyl dehydrogenase n=1 Tax=Alkalibacterium putridalgicola TaxID=426703 RepID=UPI0034CD1949
MTDKKQTVVVGAGPGGYVSAIRAAQLGQKVTIIEKQYFGGTCLNIGCIPSKALITAAHRYHDTAHSETFGITAEDVKVDLEKTQDWKENQVVKTLTTGVKGLLKKNKVEMMTGTASFKDKNHLIVETDKGSQEIEFENVILATGTNRIELEEVPFGERVLDTTGGLNIKKAPKSIVIIGGGYVGSQLAAAYSNFGVHVTVLEKEAHMMPFFDEDMAKIVEKNYRNKGMDIITGVNVKSSKTTEEDITITYEKAGEEKTVTAEVALISVGRKPNTDNLNLEAAGIEATDEGYLQVSDTLQTNVEGIYAVGDIVPGVTLANKASHEAKLVASVIAGEEVDTKYKQMPIAVYTEPALATAGVSFAEAKASDGKYKISKFSLAGNGRALSLNQTEGFVRMITDSDNHNTIVGAQIVGAGAPDIISELSLAIETGMNAEDISLTIHSHPSVAEAIMDTAELALDMPIHV